CVRVSAEASPRLVTTWPASKVNEESVFDLAIIVFPPSCMAFVRDKEPPNQRGQLVVSAGDVLQVRVTGAEPPGAGTGPVTAERVELPVDYPVNMGIKDVGLDEGPPQLVALPDLPDAIRHRVLELLEKLLREAWLPLGRPAIPKADCIEGLGQAVGGVDIDIKADQAPALLMLFLRSIRQTFSELLRPGHVDTNPREAQVKQHRDKGAPRLERVEETLPNQERVHGPGHTERQVGVAFSIGTD